MVSFERNKKTKSIATNSNAGTEFRYTPDSVCMNTPTAYRTIFGPKGNVKKSEYYKVWPRTEDTVNTWSTTSIPQHSRKRRVLNYAFSESALRGAETFIQANVDRWLELLGKQRTGANGWTTPINMGHQVTYLVFDILGDLCFGKCFDMKEPDSKLRHVPEMMIGFMELIHPVRDESLLTAYMLTE
jgi:cytochrome P450